MWTEADRSTYRRAGDRLPSDLSDGEWERLAPLIPPAKPGGRPRKTDMRSAMNAIFYFLRTGCPWRFCRAGFPAALDGLQHLPRFPAAGRVGGDLGGTARGAARTAGAEASPSAGVIDSGSLKSAEKGDARKVKQTQWVMTPARG